MIQFETPSFLFLILILIPALVYVFFNIIKIKKAYGNTKDSKNIIRRIIIRTLFFYAAWIFLAGALAVPLWGTKPVSVRRHGVSVMLVADISKSMTIRDMGQSRLDFQKYFLKIISDNFKNAACGLVITKGTGILSVPLTFEKQALFSALDSLSPHILTSAGTDLEAGVLKALDSFSENRGNSKIIILCTDGGESSGSLLRACNTIKNSDAHLIIAGFGTEKGGELEIFDEKGNTKIITTKLEKDFLMQAAERAGEGSLYVCASAADSVHHIIKIVNEGTEADEKLIFIQKPVKRNFEASLLAFICICLGGLPFYAKNK